MASSSSGGKSSGYWLAVVRVTRLNWCFLAGYRLFSAYFSWTNPYSSESRYEAKYYCSLPCQMMGFVGGTLNFFSKTYRVWMQWSCWTIPQEQETLEPMLTLIDAVVLWTCYRCRPWRQRRWVLFREPGIVYTSWQLVAFVWWGWSVYSAREPIVTSGLYIISKRTLLAVRLNCTPKKYL